jgi:hypothetical protein
VTGGWKKLHNEELHNVYSSADTVKMIKVRNMRGSGRVAFMERSEIRTFSSENLNGRLGGRCEDNIKMDIKEIGWECMEFIH